MRKVMKAIHLCSGAGGITLGFERAGIETTFAFDYNPIVVETHKMNFPNAPCEVMDIRDVRAGDLPACDIVTCGIPCEAYSIAGYRRGLADERDISPDVARLLAELAARPSPPRYVFLENVPPYRDTPAATMIREALCDYHIAEAIFRHADYGVCQKRKRWHLIASLQHPIPIPEPTCAETVNLFGLRPWIRFKEIREDPPTDPRYITSKAWRGILRRQTRAEILMAERGKNQCYAKCYVVDDDDLMPTVLASWHKGVSRSQAVIVFDDYRWRAPTFLETTRAQGFSDTFVFCGNKRERYEQIGRAVPPPFAEAMARAILKYT